MLKKERNNFDQSSHSYNKDRKFSINQNQEGTKQRPISALLSLKIQQKCRSPNQTFHRSPNERDFSFERLQKKKEKFIKNFVIPEMEAKNQSDFQFIDDLYSFYDTIINDKKEDFLPFYVINSQKSKISQKFICLNRRTKTSKIHLALPKQNQNNKELKQISRKDRVPPQIFKHKPSKIDISELELLSLLKQEEDMSKANYNRIFALTEKENIKKYPKTKEIKEKVEEKIMNTININELNYERIMNQTQKPEKTNFFQHHLKEIKSKTSNSLHHIPNLVSCENSRHQTQNLQNLKFKRKKFNFSKPKAQKMESINKESLKGNKITLNLKGNEKLLAQVINDQTSRRTEMLQGWNEDGRYHNDEDYNFNN